MVDSLRLAKFVNMIIPNPIALQVLAVAEVVQAILDIIISSYDMINNKKEVFDAIIDIITSLAELVPLTGVNNAAAIKSTVHTVSFIERICR